MKILLWIVQVLVGVAFLGAGFIKLSMPIEELGTQMAFVNDIPAWLTRFIGASELLGGLGVLLPSLLRIQPRLTVLAAAGLALIMVLAAIFHATRGEFGEIVPNVVLLALSAFVAYGRSKLYPIAPKSAAVA
jgi:uncharacterized membrane protein YphA (DoxX/SURF4 family)